MKNKATRFLLALALAASIVTTGLITGCGSTPQKIAYQGVSTTQITADAALDLWGKYVSVQKAAGRPVPVSQELAVRAAYQKVQASMLVVCDAGAVWSAGTNSTNSVALAAAFQVAISNSTQSLADLTNLLKTYGVTIP